MAKEKKRGKLPPGLQEETTESSGGAKLDINTFEDVADSEDEFNINQDKILLEEGPARKRQRKFREEEQLLEPSDEEVLPVEDEISSSLAEDESEGLEEDDALHRDPAAVKGAGKPLQSDSDDEESGALSQDKDEEGWGSSKQDYYDADVIETEADALEEEAEAKRLQDLQLQDMTAADFGFDEAAWLDPDGNLNADRDGKGVRREVLPKFEITDDLGPQERIKIMRSRYPEFEPLAAEFLNLQSDFDDLSHAAKRTAGVGLYNNSSKASGSDVQEQLPPSETVASLKYRALSAYLGALSMYFALLTSGGKLKGGEISIMSPEDLREHAVMDTLIQCRDLWVRLKDVPLPEAQLEEQHIGAAVEHHMNGFNDESEISTLDPGATSQPQIADKLSKHHQKRIRKAARLALAAQEEAKARQSERLRQAELSMEGLPDFTTNSVKAPPSSIKETTQALSEDDHSDFGDATSLTAYEAAEKAKRKKTLKFYTSQIAQTSNRRGGAGRDAGGDTDLPYRERLRDRQERMRAEAERRGDKAKNGKAGTKLGEGSSDDDAEITNAQRRQHDNAGDSEDDYYNLIVKRASDKKASKAANAKAYAAKMSASSTADDADKNGVDTDGKRAITYAIEKNKGLHPHRKKDVRNPRVKKRKKFEDKQKKLKSMRAVYRPEREGKGGYGGEKTGIKGSLVRSVKL